ncbi:hypothetical protein GCM10007416_00060 [Kroppenstedtia guangzhouensis]|uniref:Uncharacterized protein n=1 Tax=Kroppenstedtia guangzhouensis TaxID=1274356 RepID=A0ABQ1FXA2_9BACL|nr:hypothetical protein [Kroppenstedtia guangzhouensis]GGA31537.1 hypothetical protein GCM10007416_00060 [Kroppenstedtia guangzhouensis]
MELAVVLSLLALLIPVVLGVNLELERSFKKTMAEQQLHSAAETFIADVRDELRRGENFRLSPTGWLIFDLPEGETIRYKHQRRRVIRSVRGPGTSRFQGATILLEDVYFIGFDPGPDGVRIDLGLQNWHGDLDTTFFVRGRLTQ